MGGPAETTVLLWREKGGEMKYIWTGSTVVPRLSVSDVPRGLSGAKKLKDKSTPPSKSGGRREKRNPC